MEKWNSCSKPPLSAFRRSALLMSGSEVHFAKCELSQSCRSHFEDRSSPPFPLPSWQWEVRPFKADVRDDQGVCRMACHTGHKAPASAVLKRGFLCAVSCQGKTHTHTPTPTRNTKYVHLATVGTPCFQQNESIRSHFVSLCMFEELNSPASIASSSWSRFCAPRAECKAFCPKACVRKTHRDHPKSTQPRQAEEIEEQCAQWPCMACSAGHMAKWPPPAAEIRFACILL